MADKDPSALPTSRIGQTELLVVVWVLAGVACLLFGARIAVRVSIFRRIFVDDGFAFLALMILIAHAIITTAMSPAMYKLLAVEAGRQKVTPDFPEEVTFFLKLQFSATVLFWSCLWAVKGCFLAFFYKMTEGLRPQRTMLWVVIVITALSYIGSVITYPVSCSSFELGGCSTQLNVDRSLISLRYSTAVDIITDLLIIAIPMWLCWQVRISARQKLGLYSVLCLGVIIIVFSVVRVIVVGSDGLHPEPSWLAAWSAVEASVAVTVSCLSSFKALFTKRSRQTTGSSSNGRYYQKHGHGTDARSERDRDGYHVQPRDQSEEHELHNYADAGRSANAAVVDVKRPGVSEESIELPEARQASFESQARILRTR